MKINLLAAFGNKKNSGFSLVELMVVVAIIGILAALAVPKFQTFQAKARQSEAKTNLSHIYTLEVSYHGENNTYLALTSIGATNNCVLGANTLGFTLTDCTKVRYDYVTTAATISAFTAQATNVANRRINPACTATALDQWTINEAKTLTNVNDGAKGC